MEATAGTLRLSNQKNGVRGAMVHRSAIPNIVCPVKALVRRFIHLRDNHARGVDIISSYWDHLDRTTVVDVDIRVALRQAVIKLDLGKNGITAGRVGSHSLRAGGAMSLKFAGADRDDIKKMGRWSSDTFLIYIHDQIAEYLEGWTEKCPSQDRISIWREHSRRGEQRDAIVQNRVQMDVVCILCAVVVKETKNKETSVSPCALSTHPNDSSNDA